MVKANHHTVPDFYLKKFKDISLREYRVWQYEKGQEPRAVPTVRTAAIDNYYTLFIGKGHFAWDAAEKSLSSQESKAAQLFANIESREFSSSDKKAFAEWMDTQITRVPCYRDCMVETIQRHFRVDVRPSYALAYVMKKTSSFLAEFRWGFLAATGIAKFVTSDNPVHYFHSGAVYPLNPRLALLVSDMLDVEGLTEASPDVVEMINLSTIMGASRYVFASECLPGLDTTVQKSLGKENLQMVHNSFLSIAKRS